MQTKTSIQRFKFFQLRALILIGILLSTIISYSKSYTAVFIEVKNPDKKDQTKINDNLKIQEFKPHTVYLFKSKEIQEQNEDQIFESVEHNPEFKGGKISMYKFLGSNIIYPKAAQKAKKSGRVFVRFVVEKDGSLSNFELLESLGYGCDEEAIRVIKSMPKWIPGTQNGKPVRVYYKMPIVYKLN